MSVSITLAELEKIATESFRRAKSAAERRDIPKVNYKAFSDSLTANLSHFTKESAHAATLADEPAFSTLERFDGMRAWAALVSFDLRKSTRRAVEIGPKDTYITMHTYLTTMLEVVRAGEGKVVGLRGDGAIAMFGAVVYERGVVTATPLQIDTAVNRACDCGASLVTTVERVVNPVLQRGGVRAGLAIGVGVDVGEFVATSIGIERAYELTAYGDCVNRACHIADHGTNRVVVTNDVRRMFPTVKGGRTMFPAVPNQKECYFLNYPDDYHSIR